MKRIILLCLLVLLICVATLTSADPIMYCPYRTTMSCFQYYDHYSHRWLLYCQCFSSPEAASECERVCANEPTAESRKTCWANCDLDYRPDV